eukprot:366222-Chlamydomonas_euryale.AAC.8
MRSTDVRRARTRAAQQRFLIHISTPENVLACSNPADSEGRRRCPPAKTTTRRSTTRSTYNSSLARYACCRIARVADAVLPPRKTRTRPRPALPTPYVAPAGELLLTSAPGPYAASAQQHLCSV